MKYSKNSTQPKSFKKRSPNGYSTRFLKYGNSGVFFFKNYRIENSYLFDLKKKFKFFLVKQKKGLNNKLWISIIRNHPISKKSKNSRMGKGAGKFLRLCTRVKKNSMFLEFLNMNPLILKKILNYFSKKNNIYFSFIHKNTPRIFWKTTSITYFKQYNRF